MYAVSVEISLLCYFWCSVVFRPTSVLFTRKTLNWTSAAKHSGLIQESWFQPSMQHACYSVLPKLSLCPYFCLPVGWQQSWEAGLAAALSWSLYKQGALADHGILGLFSLSVKDHQSPVLLCCLCPVSGRTNDCTYGYTVCVRVAVDRHCDWVPCSPFIQCTDGHTD